MNISQLVYKPGKELIGYQEANYLYTISGVSYGKVQDKYVFDKNGNYIGEFNFANQLVVKVCNRQIESYTLPKNQSKLPKKLMLVGITKKLGELTKPYHGGSSGAFNEYPNTEELEKLH